MTPLIETRKLHRDFGGRTALSQLDLDVQPGEVFGLVGPDGAGKTTTMRLLAAVLAPTSGDAWVCGRHVVEEPESVKRLIGYMSQRFGLYPDLTVQENLDFYADLYGVSRKEREVRTQRLLAFSGLTPFGKRQAGRLSGGMKQKLGLACALIHTPKVLLLDEPTNGVDPVSRRDFWRILYQMLREGVTIFVSTAYLDEAERCNRLALLHQGRLLACGTPEEVKTRIGTHILEIRAPEPREVLTVLRTVAPQSNPGLFGDCVHVVAGSMTSNQIHHVLNQHGIRDVSILPKNPSLEDVFVTVLDTLKSSEKSV